MCITLSDVYSLVVFVEPDQIRYIYMVGSVKMLISYVSLISYVDPDQNAGVAFYTGRAISGSELSLYILT